MDKVIVVTRHKSLINYLKEQGANLSNVKVYEHASPELVKDNIVIGVLPYSLSCLAKRYIEVSLTIPQEYRGIELSLEQIKECNPILTEYNVNKVDNIDINRGDFIKKFLK